MRLKGILLVVLTTVVVGGSAGAGAMHTFEMRDGSVITGELISFENGTYTVRSGSLGVITFEAFQVSASRSGASAGGTESGARQGIEGYRQQIMSDPGIMQMLTALQDDPEVMQLIGDPKFLRLIQAGDMAALRKDPKFNALLRNPTIRSIIDRVSPP